jgi:hypothetical protein
MADIILRCSGPDLSIDDALSLVDRSRLIRFTNAGERYLKSLPPAEQSEFNLQISENEGDPAAALSEARRFVEKNLRALIALTVRGCTPSLDIGITVDATGPGMKSVLLEPEFLDLLARARLALQVTSYVECDDDEDSADSSEARTQQ